MPEGRREEYLRKALDADELAKRAHSPEARQTWERIAEDYRMLALLSDASHRQP